MYVCICNAVTDEDIREAAEAGATSVADLQDQLGVAINCGSCFDDAAALLASDVAQTQPNSPPVPQIFRPALA